MSVTAKVLFDTPQAEIASRIAQYIDPAGTLLPQRLSENAAELRHALSTSQIPQT